MTLPRLQWFNSKLIETRAGLKNPKENRLKPHSLLVGNREFYTNNQLFVYLYVYIKQIVFGTWCYKTLLKLNKVTQYIKINLVKN